MDGLIASVLPDLKVVDQYVSESLIVLLVASRRRGNPCPSCLAWSARVHSTYGRTVQDVPLGGAQVVLRVVARKFFCDNPLCAQMIFTERFPGLLARSQQKTSRLNQMLTRIAFELGGNPGAALARRLGVVVSRDTMLARIRKAEIPEPPDIQEIHVVGIDDWAYRRGCRYGTLICDLERHRVIDVLPDRSVATVSTWLKNHPTIQRVSRDRANAYADAIRRGLPHARQVADRWHLLKNLGDAAQHYLTRQRIPMRETDNSCVPSQDKPGPATEPSIPHPPSPDPSQTARRQAKWQRVQEVQCLYHAGVGKREISRRTGLSRQTISTYLTWTEVPQTIRPPQCTLLDSYRHTVAELVRQSQTGRAILRQIREKGYTGSLTTLNHYVAECRRALKSGQGPRTVHRRRRVSPRQAAILLTQKEVQINDRDKPYRDQLLQEVPGATELQGMCQSFHHLVETHDSAGLSEWIQQALRCGIRELQTFATGVQMDLEAIVAGIQGPWSNGQLEGQINRLKTLKRQMYGRASFDLLRARVLYHT